MAQLSGLDAAFLAMETENVHAHGGGVCILEPPPGGPTLTLDLLVTAIEERLHLVPLFRQRLLNVPFGLDQPYWIEDPDLDVSRHVEQTSLPDGATEDDVADLIATLHARKLDRNRPLWELHLVHGLAGGRQAIYLKVHHAAIDGVSGNDLLSALLDRCREGGSLVTAAPPAPAPRPSTSRMVAQAIGTIVGHPSRAANLGYLVGRASPTILARITQRLPGMNRLVPGDPEVDTRHSDGSLRAPTTQFNKSIGPRRRLVFRSVPLASVRAVKDELGTTVNDILLAMSAGALRRWLMEQDALPSEPLVAAIPVSTRTPESSTTGGNSLTMMFAPIPTNEPDPALRAKAAHEAMRRAKELYGALPANLLTDITKFAMPSVAELAFRLSARLRVLERVKLCNLIVSNVPGPQEPLYLVGSRMLAYFPISQVVDGQGVNITMLSYAGQIHIGVLCDPDLAPDLDHLADYLVDELDALTIAIRKP